ncbi:MAG: SHOCT domain-containing protein [Eubacteriales bacterium]
MASEFSATQSFGQFIQFDDNSHCFKLEGSMSIFNYDNIAGYRYIEEKGSLGKSGVARAFSVGVIGDNQGLFIATKMCIKIVLKDGNPKDRYLNMLITPTKSNNIVYRSLKKSADDIISKLQMIQPDNCEENYAAIGYAEELRNLKQLLDEGIITQDDFNAKKKQILGI